MSDFTWHKMADEQPTNSNVTYVIVGKRGAMYLASLYVWQSGALEFYIKNNRDPWMKFDKVEAWAEIPPFKEGD